MESLQSWGFMGDIHIGYGFFRRKIAGNIMMLWRWFGVAFGVAESPEGDGPYGSPPGRSFCAYKRNQNTVKGDSFPLDELLSVACSAGYERCKGIVRTAHRYAPKVAAGASAPTALRCPKKSSRCSLARFFRPLRVLRLAASATGGARLRTRAPRPPLPPGSHNKSQ